MAIHVGGRDGEGQREGYGGVERERGREEGGKGDGEVGREGERLIHGTTKMNLYINKHDDVITVINIDLSMVQRSFP